MAFNKITAITEKFVGQPYDLNSVLGPDGIWAKLDAPSEQVRAAFDSLIDELVALNLVEVPHSSDIKAIRINVDNVIEITLDGTTWTATGSSGHLILDKLGNILPQRSRLKFMGEVTVTDDGTNTVISGVKGDKGDKGDTGSQGIQGIQGIQGDLGPAIVPSIDTNGVMSFTIQETAIAPNSVSVRGPQGPQGVQGSQGVAGPQGVQGIQGSTGPMGPQGLTGDDGADGRSFIIKALYATLYDLQINQPTGVEGDAYAIGTSTNNTIYIWDVVRTQWYEVGPLQGPIGPQGPAGAQGVEGIQGPQGIQGVSGVAGKSAYTAAVEAGYAGTETAFNEILVEAPTYAGTGRTTETIKGNADAISNLAGVGRTTETVKGNTDALDEHKADTTTAHGAVSTATPSKIIIRDAAGRAKVAAPSAEDDIALKSNVTTVETDLNAHKADFVRQPAFGPTTGSANTYLFASTPALPALVDGVSAYLDINVANTGESTLNWNGKGAHSIRDGKGAVLTAGKMPLNGIVGVRYNASTGNFQLLGEGGDYGTAGQPQVLTGYTVGTSSGVLAGMIAIIGSPTITPTTADQPLSAGYYSGGTVQAISYSAGDNLAFVDDLETYKSSTAGYQQTTQAFKVQFTGTVRVSFDLRSGGSSGTAHAMLYKNGVAVGIARSTNSTTYVTFTEDLSVVSGDIITIWGYPDYASYNAYFKNLSAKLNIQGSVITA